MQYSLMIADDEIGIRELLKELFKDKYTLHVAEDGEDAINLLKEKSPDIALIDIRMPKKNGIQILTLINDKKLPTIPIIITADKDINTAIKAMKLGAFDYIVKPFETDRIDNLVKNATEKVSLQKRIQQLSTELSQEYNFENIIGTSIAMKSIYTQIKNVISNDATVLIAGKSGTGKELIAKAIHYNSQRNNYPFIPVDCASIPETLIESELFGHEKGSFTGALSRKIGKFELANHGTIFLDEIGNLRLDVQAKLLRILQEKEFTRVGSNEKIKVDVRIISATNADLEKLISEGKFREDLFYRLNVVPITLPPLSEREDDIIILSQYFLDKYNKKYIKEVKIDKEVLLFFKSYSWPGNVRELENTIQRLILTCNKIIKVSDLPDNIKTNKIVDNKIFQEGRTLDEVEKIFIKKNLMENNYNISKTAKLLGITRKTLHNKFEKYPELKKLIQQKN